MFIKRLAWNKYIKNGKDSCLYMAVYKWFFSPLFKLFLAFSRFSAMSLFPPPPPRKRERRKGRKKGKKEGREEGKEGGRKGKRGRRKKREGVRKDGWKEGREGGKQKREQRKDNLHHVSRGAAGRWATEWKKGSFGSSWNEGKHEYNLNGGSEAGRLPPAVGGLDLGNDTCMFYLRSVTTFSVKNLL